MSGPAPAVAAVRTAVRGALADVPPGATVLVACSGGADSLALAAGLAHEARRRARGGTGLVAGAVVVDHGLQDGSAAVAAAAATACRGLGLDPVDVVRVEVGGDGGPEAAARTARYAALDDAARRAGAAAVLLGHTLDDQAEGVLLALARGSGERALAGMRPVRGLLRRPLLGLRRTCTEDACAAQGLAPWQDPTNGRDAPAGVAALPLRSRVRRDVLPVLEDVLGPGVAEALARTADALAESADALDALAADLLRAAAVDPGGDDRAPLGADVLALDVDVLAGAPSAVRRRALHTAAVRSGVPAGALARAHVLAVDALLGEWRGQGDVHLPGARAARRSCGRLYLGGLDPRPADPLRGAPGRSDGGTTGDEHDERE
ncbi:tRNA lysidine(34) synthetase TilS [Cellulomonas shaoxiangyii]|uniref:tRNA(Ile)-lysidine synthase n=1 Tax=Cellulomonas shaoxiangyii TaxID=2566013 RepID=A0A4V1CMZ1_9CELL|nr:tRNA lysidine(34) synthetase TilS [Cellulomonas shaoxiangyii]QCB94625.1 tRNA lysidine(34) synthetase TilS [Cellulomonas shaoxiangyii]TGY78898.1 tRNA lysidine(34) synthetase TilS [Cellulomonas shaoxiangyii]